MWFSVSVVFFWEGGGRGALGICFGNLVLVGSWFFRVRGCKIDSRCPWHGGGGEGFFVSSYFFDLSPTVDVRKAGFLGNRTSHALRTVVDLGDAES